MLIKCASTHDQDSETKREGNTRSQREMETQRESSTGSTFSAQQGVTVIGREGDIALTGSALHSERGAIGLQAKRDVLLESVTERESIYSEARFTRKNFLILADSAPAYTHFLPEVRPFPGQRLALFKNAPGVFVHGVGRFALRSMLPAC